MKRLLPMNQQGELQVPQFILMSVFVAFFVGLLTKAFHAIDTLLILQLSGLSSVAGTIVLIQALVVSTIEFIAILRRYVSRKVIQYIHVRIIHLYHIILSYISENTDFLRLPRNKQLIYCVFRC